MDRVLSAVRKADEFNTRVSLVKPPKTRGAVTSWTLEAIRGARDAQVRGDFKRAVQLAEAMRTDDAIFVARNNRIAPHSAIEAALEAYRGVEGERVWKKAKRSISTPRDVLQGINGTLADHGIAIGRVVQEPNDDGTLVNMRLTEWPLEHVKYNEQIEFLETDTAEHGRVPIVHGDGTWIIFRKFDLKPWTQDACILPAAFLWAMHTSGLADWASAMKSHGLAKVVGMLPEGIALLNEAGELTAEASAFLDMITDIASGDASSGIVPPGGKAEFVNNSSSAWQVFSEMIVGREKAAARIYLGTDAILGSVGGAPGVDIAALFGVATTKIQGDFEALEQGINTGLIAPWCAINFGDSTHAPRFRYQFPDPDADRKSEEYGARLARLFDAMDRMQKSGFGVDQDVVNKLCAEFRVKPFTLAQQDTKRAPLQLAPTDLAKVVKVREARASQGLAPLGNATDDLFISQMEAQAEAQAKTQVAEVEAEANAEAEIKVAEETDAGSTEPG